MTHNIVHFTPADQTADQAYIDAIVPCFREIQAWVSAQLGGPTFPFTEPVVVKGLEPTQYYAPPPQPGLDVGYNVWRTILPEIAARGFAPDSCSPPFHVLVILTHGLPGNGGTPCIPFSNPITGNWHYAGDGGGLAMFPEAALHAFMGREHPWYENTGWIVHEAVLHAGSVPHPRSCELSTAGFDPSSPEWETSPFDGLPLENVDCAVPISWSAHAYPHGKIINTTQYPEADTLRGHPQMSLAGVPGGAEPPPAPAPPPEPSPEPEEPAPEPEEPCCTDPEPDTRPPKPPKGGWGRGGRRR